MPLKEKKAKTKQVRFLEEKERSLIKTPVSMLQEERLMNAANDEEEHLTMLDMLVSSILNVSYVELGG